MGRDKGYHKFWLKVILHPLQSHKRKAWWPRICSTSLLGGISPQEVQSSADLTCKDIVAAGGKPHGDLKALASLGSNGRFKEHMHRQLVAFATQDLLLSPVHSCYIPFEGVQQPVFQSMIRPHVLFSDLYHHYKAAWDQHILPDTGAIAKFWKLQEQHPAFKKHPLSKKANYQSKCVPLLVHGDGTPVVSIGKLWSKQLTIFSWASML